jgi:hypothetical protein
MPGLFTQKKDPHHGEAVAALRQLRKSIDELYRLRALNQLAIRGQDRTCPFGAEEMQARLRVFRDPEMEDRFRDELYRLTKIILRREPTQDEILAGPPSGEGLGLVPLLFGVGTIVAGTAWGLNSVTNYLTERERIARNAQERSDSFLARLGTMMKGALLVGTVAASSYGGYRAYKWLKTPPGTKALPKKKKEAPKLPEPEPEPEEEPEVEEAEELEDEE